MSQTFAFKDGDWVMEPNGQPKMLSGFDKAGFDLMHCLLHPYDPETDYGNESFSMEVQVAERAAIVGIVQRDIDTAIGRLRKKQAQTPRQYLLDNERIVGIKSLVVKPFRLGADYYVVAQVADRSAEDLRKAFRITNEHLYRGT